MQSTFANDTETHRKVQILRLMLSAMLQKQEISGLYKDLSCTWCCVVGKMTRL